MGGCVEPPDAPSETDGNVPQFGALILCEGLWHYNNSSMSAYHLETQTMNKNIYKSVNRSNLGDVANSIHLRGDTAFIAITSSNMIEVVDIRSGKSLGSMYFDENLAPRSICFVNDTSAYFSSLYKHAIYEFNPETLDLTGRTIQTGPAPEDIIYMNYRIFAANSGYGDYLADRVGAGTISVIDPVSGSETARLECGPNPMRLIADRRRGNIIASYFNLPSKPDSAGGIVIYDSMTLRKVDSVRLMLTDLSKMAFNQQRTYLYCITRRGIARFSMQQPRLIPELVIGNPDTTEFWYALACDRYGRIWTGNARNYQTAGEIIVFDPARQYQAVERIPSGINPNSIVFY
jgi:hypothetical protein